MATCAAPAPAREPARAAREEGGDTQAVQGRDPARRQVPQVSPGATDAATRLRRLLEADWAAEMAASPEWATRIGHPGFDDRWSDLSPEAIAAVQARVRRSLAELETIPREELSPADRLNHDLYRRHLRLQAESQRFPSHLMPLNQMDGVQQTIPDTLVLMPARRTADYEAMLARLEKVPLLVEQTLALLRDGAARGLTPPRITLRDVPAQVLAVVAPDSPLLRPFARFPDTVPAAQQEQLRAMARRLVAEEVTPAFRRLHDYLVSDYIPAARESVGLADLPDGAAWYAHAVRAFTTTGLSPREIHDVGLAEVARLRAAMDAIIEDVGFSGSFAQFLEFLRTDPRFYFDDAGKLLAASRDIAKRADPELARLFGTLPRLPYGVEPVPAHAEKSQTTAYYQPGSLAAGRAGIYFVNTYALHTRPRWEMEALTLHEAVPGHHLQITLAQELEALPMFRRHGGITAFVEGWALYAESLGEEMGFYTDPYARFGRLTYEMWRAVRLVVDTGLHAMGWSRRQAIDFFRQNAAKSEHDIVVEVDRYLVWPGQALGYKIGELKIKELRAHAEAALGERFHIRAFHDQILGQGPLPLEILEARTRAWVDAESSREGS